MYITNSQKQILFRNYFQRSVYQLCLILIVKCLILYKVSIKLGRLIYNLLLRFSYV